MNRDCEAENNKVNLIATMAPDPMKEDAAKVKVKEKRTDLTAKAAAETKGLGVQAKVNANLVDR